MQPYQEASQEIVRQSKEPAKLLKNAASFAAGTAGAGAIYNRISPLLNKFIPGDIATKGLEKIDPRFGKFIKGAIEQGNPEDKVMDFLRDKSESEKEPAKEKRNVIQQHSDKLFQFLEQQINKGRSPDEAGALAMLQDEFKPIISKIENKNKTNFSNILKTIFGGAQQAKPTSIPSGSAELNAFTQPSQSQSQQMQPHPNSAKGQQLSRQQGQEQGQGDQSLLAAMQKILSM